MIQRMCAAYGTRIERVLHGARRLEDLGQEIAPQLFEAELEYLRGAESARGGQDVLWRRSKLGLTLDSGAVQRVERWLAAHRAPPAIRWPSPRSAACQPVSSRATVSMALER